VRAEPPQDPVRFNVGALTELPHLLGAGVIAQFALLDGPVVQQVLGLQPADLPEWTTAVLRMEALGHFIERGSTELIENLVWLELAAAALGLMSSPSNTSGMSN
jgi:hypothetical protein